MDFSPSKSEISIYFTVTQTLFQAVEWLSEEPTASPHTGLPARTTRACNAGYAH